ncbi:hypothetical protein JXA63_01560 [Candidatus Woesebacteria bacterium]|nr:hypothetical protein [Candidatus Woesebacteria bacterium]
MTEENQFRTPGLDGNVLKDGSNWRTTTYLPTVHTARITEPPEFLAPGMHIKFDLLTETREDGNIYTAVDVRRFEQRTNQKVTPKTRELRRRGQ